MPVMPLANPAAESVARLTGTSTARQVTATATRTTIADGDAELARGQRGDHPDPDQSAGQPRRQRPAEPPPVDVVVVGDQGQARHQHRDHQQRAGHQRRLEQRGDRRRDQADPEADRRLDDRPEEDGRRDHGVRRRVHPAILFGQAPGRAAGGSADGSAAGAESGSSGSAATCSRHHWLTSGRRRAPRRGTPAKAPTPRPRPPRVRAGLAGRRGHEDRAQLVLDPSCERPRLDHRAVAERREQQGQVLEVEPELLAGAPAHRLRDRLARCRVAAAAVGPDAAEGRLGERPLGDEQPARHRRRRSRRTRGAAGCRSRARRDLSAVPIALPSSSRSDHLARGSCGPRQLVDHGREDARQPGRERHDPAAYGRDARRREQGVGQQLVAAAELPVRRLVVRRAGPPRPRRRPPAPAPARARCPRR